MTTSPPLQRRVVRWTRQRQASMCALSMDVVCLRQRKGELRIDPQAAFLLSPYGTWSIELALGC